MNEQLTAHNQVTSIDFLTDHIEILYKEAFPRIAKYIISRGGSIDQAKDLFQDALVVLLEKDADLSVTEIGDKWAYLFGIVKNQWIKKIQRERHMVEMTLGNTVESNRSQTVMVKKLQRLIDLGGEKCLQLLRSVYHTKLPMQEIARKLKYRNAHTASVKKYKCLAKIKQMIRSKSLSYEDFME